MGINKTESASSKLISSIPVEDLIPDKPDEETLPPVNIPDLNLPTFILAMQIKEISESLPLFEKISDNVIRLNNPHFVQVHCLIPQTEKPSCSTMTVSNESIKDGKCEYWSAFPSNSGGVSKLAWDANWPSDTIDWRTGGSFDITLPSAGVYCIQSRGPDFSIQSYVVDTRWESPSIPTKLVAKNIGSQKVNLSWSDSSNNETAFHIFVEQYVGDKWVKLPSFIRVPANNSTIDYQAKAGYYRFSIRSAMSTVEESWSFSRRISSNLEEPLQTISFVTPSVVKYSEVTDYVYLLVSGTLANPAVPSNFGGTSRPDKSIFFVWQDNSNNETVFHLLEEQWINNAWVRQPLIRISPDTSLYALDPRQPGKYRYALRSAYSFPDTTIVRTSAITRWIEFTIP